MLHVAAQVTRGEPGPGQTTNNGLSLKVTRDRCCRKLQGQLSSHATRTAAPTCTHRLNEHSTVTSSC